MTPISKRFEIVPLTKSGKNGQLYFRRDETIKQLTELQTSPDGVIEKRILVEREDQPDSLKSETLVFLLRTFEPIDPALAEDIFVMIALRARNIVLPFRSRFNDPADFEDFVGDLNVELMKRLRRVDSNIADYAQVSFGPWVIYLANNLWRKFESANKVVDESDSTDADPDDTENWAPRIQLASSDIGPEIRILIDEALGQMSGKKKDAWLLKVKYGWKISSKDEKEPTIAAYFNVSERTIRNWLDDVEETLRIWRGEGR